MGLGEKELILNGNEIDKPIKIGKISFVSWLQMLL